MQAVQKHLRHGHATSSSPKDDAHLPSKSSRKSEESHPEDDLIELTRKLRHALRKHKDLGKEKYQKCYLKCKTERDALEKQAVEAIDAGEADIFERLASIVHAASEAIENFDNELQKQKSANVNGAGESSRKESWAADPWALFPDQGDEGNRERNPPSARNGRSFMENSKASVSTEWTSKHKTHSSKTASAMMILPSNASFAGSTSSHGSKGRPNRYENHIVSRRGSGDWSASRPAQRVTSATYKKEGSYKETDFNVYNIQSTDYKRRDYFKGNSRDAYNAGFGTGEYGADDQGVYDGDEPVEYAAHRRFDRNDSRHLRYGDKSLEGKNGNDASLQHVSDDLDHDYAPRAYDHDRRNTTINEDLDDDRYYSTHKSQPRDPMHKNQEAQYATYCDLLERCIEIADGKKLAKQLKQLNLAGKITFCKNLLEVGDKDVMEPDVPVTPIIKSTTKPPHDNVLSRIARKTEEEQHIDRDIPEPLSRVQDDGGVSAYLGNYVANGGHLFEGIHFTADLSMRPRGDSGLVEVITDVRRKLHNMDIYTELRGPGTEKVRMLASTATSLTFVCEPGMWAHTLPFLAVSIVESDGTNVEILIKLPIGPFSFFQPADIPRTKIDRIIENNAKVGFYTIHKAFALSTNLHMHDLLAAMEKYFAISKTNTKQTLAAVDLNGQILVAVLYTRSDALMLDVWSPNVKTLQSACTYIKEIAAALAADTDEKAAIRAMRTMSLFPLEFEQASTGYQSTVRSKSAGVNSGTSPNGVAKSTIPGTSGGGAAPA